VLLLLAANNRNLATVSGIRFSIDPEREKENGKTFWVFGVWSTFEDEEEGPTCTALSTGLEFAVQ